ncbi:uncharacterized protein A4U43_C01F5220 [Asparagus officinalis]|uniref:3-hydroxyacyl-CoA dehydrogenase NAD binding domain-containing protein n=1 Tax=Asparagus officinalis TaxID=4686 RepID=A0A5P1FLX9_ASPOF|nr:uncharacterized protein A4U43_C01F5220 [Asparagus officinalis]
MQKGILSYNCVLDYESFKDIDMVIEAVTENMTSKQQIFAELEKYCPPHCILASNTSTIYFNLIGEKTRCQDRIIGANFFRFPHCTGIYTQEQIDAWKKS